ELLKFYLKDDGETLSLPPASEPGSEETDPVKGAVLKRIQHAKSVLRGAPANSSPGDGIPENVKFIVQTYRPRLVEWDIRFSYFQNLLDLNEIALEAKDKDISAFIKARLQNIKETAQASAAQRKALGAAGLMSLVTTLLSILLKVFQEQIT